jgi:DNA-binding NarL/FixJ family response regulator
MTTLNQPLRALARHKEPLLATGINAALMAAPGIEVVMTSAGTSLPEADVVICDYDSGMAWAQHRRCHSAAARRAAGVVVITERDREGDVRAALHCGIGGYLLGGCEPGELVDAVRAVGRGSPYLCAVAATLVATSLTRTPLTLRESEILKLIASGMSNKLIAFNLGIALGTVKAHAKSILDKLGASSRTQATVIAAQRGLLGADSPLRTLAALGDPRSFMASWGTNPAPSRIAA